MADASRPGSGISRMEGIYCQVVEQREDERRAFLNPLSSKGFCDSKKT